jgi:ribonuclease P/MRP protein subunit RPP1
MKITDACVYPYPFGDSSVRRMALEAKALGFDRLVAADTSPGEFYGVEIYAGILIRDTSVRDLINRIKREKNTKTVMSVQAGNNGFNRSVLNIKGVHILRGLHSADKNAFDHVSAKIAGDNRVAIDLDLAPLISGRGFSRQHVVQRYRDILVLERRFDFPITLSSHARSILDMRAVREITGLGSLIGMDTSDVEKAFFGVDFITAPPHSAVKVIR